MVASPNPTAAEAGLEMLQAGGNAFDAMVAAAFALCVVTPASTGIGGYGGGLVAHAANRQAVVAVDFTSAAPAAARADMFQVEEDGAGGFTVPGAVNAFGARSIGVPGIVAGLTYTLARYGTLPLATVLRPSIAAALDGFPIDRWTVAKTHEMIGPHAADYPETFKLYAIDGRLPRDGETMTNRELGRTLERIAKDGPDVFYRGDIARAIVDTVTRGGGTLTLDDLAGFKVDEHAPVRCHYRGLTICTPHLPTGGLTVLQMLRVLEGFDVASARDDAHLAHLLIETGKVCWRDRLMKYGDPRAVPVDVDAELSDAHTAALRRRAEAGVAAPGPGEIIAPDPLLVGTVHLSTADRVGNIVSLTHSHGGIGPRKRPVHNMSPLLVLDGDRPSLALGGAGGRTILSNVCHVLIRAVDRREPLDAALTARRFHIETAEPVTVEEGGEMMAEGLKRLGHRVEIRPPFGSLQAIGIDAQPDLMTGVADPRRAGTILWV
jgi:gamma-glutamyltranspeptidase/glutathione hydrolase